MNPVASNPLLLLGGKYFLNWRNHFVFAIVAMLTAVVFDANRLGGRPRDWFILALIGIAVTIGSLEIVKPILRRIKSGRSGALIATLLVVGFFRGLTLYCVGISMNLVPDEDVVYRLIGAPLFVFFSYLISSAVFEPYLNYRENYQSLSEESSRLQQAKESYSQDLMLFNQQQRSRVRELLSPPIWELQKKLEEAEDIAAIQDALLKMQAINNDVVRPLSKELAFATELTKQISKGTRQPFRRIPRQIDLAENLPFGFFVLVTSSLSFSSLITTTSSVAGLLLGAVTLGPVFIAFQFERVLFGGRPILASIGIPSSIAFSFAAGLASGLIGPALGLETPSNFEFVAALYVAIAKSFTLAYAITQRSWNQSLLELIHVTDELKRVNSWLRQRLWLGQKSLAMELHGSVQSTLHAMAARLSRMEHPNRQQLEEVVRTIRESLNRIENQEYLAGGSFQSLLAELRELWDGTAEISWKISADAEKLLEDDLGLARCLFEVIREAVVNAVKHGDAKRIDLVLSILDNELDFSVVNDGLLVSGRSGEGEKLFDQICLTHNIKSEGSQVLFSGKLSISL